MPRKFTIYATIKDKDLRPFHELLSRRDVSVDAAHAWLRRKGYRFSRSTVGHYVRFRRDIASREMRLTVGCGSDSHTRRRITELCRCLAGRELTAVVALAELFTRLGASAPASAEP